VRLRRHGAERRIACAKIILHNENLDEDATVNDASLSVRLYYLYGEHTCERFSCRYSPHIKFDIERTYRVIEYIPFDDPENLQWFVHPLREEPEKPGQTKLQEKKQFRGYRPLKPGQVAFSGSSQLLYRRHSSLYGILLTRMKDTGSQSSESEHRNESGGANT